MNEDAAKRRGFRWKFWEQVIERQKESGLSVQAFCAQERVDRSSFFSWRRRLSEEEKSSLVERKKPMHPATTADSKSAGFVELVPEEWVVRSGVRFVLPGRVGIELDRGFDPEVLRSALAVVQGMN